MIRFEIDSGRLQEALGAVSALVSECKMRFADDGLSIRAVDPANVAMVELTVDASAFEHYEADGGVLGVDLETLTDFLSAADDETAVSVELDSDRKFAIEADHLSASMALIDPDAIRQEPDIPDLDLDATITLHGRDLDRGLTAADLVSDRIQLEADEDDEVARLAAEGDTDDIEVTLDGDDLLDADVHGAPSSLFSLEYFDDVSGPIPSDAPVSVQIGSEMPTKIRYSLSDGVSVVSMIAPRISKE